MANISVQEIKVTEEHARGHHVDDRISKIQPVNKSIWQTTQFPPQPILGGSGGGVQWGEAGTYRLREMKDITPLNAMCGLCLEPQ